MSFINLDQLLVDYTTKNHLHMLYQPRSPLHMEIMGMSLEQAISANTAAVEKMTEALSAVLAGASAASTATPADEKPAKAKAADKAKPKAAAKTESDDPFATLRQDVAGWLGEFAKEEDKNNPDGIHPEVTARRDAIKATLAKLKVKQLADIKDDEGKIEKLSNWLHDKAIPVDKGFGVGRLVADPSDDDGGDDEDGLDDI